MRLTGSISVIAMLRQLAVFVVDRAREFYPNPMWRCISVAILLTSPVSLLSQTIPESTDKDIPSRSQTYSDTRKTIKKWLESEGNEDFARLLKIGDARASDLVTACQDSDEEVAAAAFEALLLLGKGECETCADSMSQMRGGLALACSQKISEADFERTESWMAKKHTGTGYECGEDFEPLTPMDVSVVYALILDGSSRARSLLDDMDGLEKACVPEETTIIGEVLGQAPSLIVAAKRAGHNLRVEPNRIIGSVRASAFFLPKKYREDSTVEIIARNKGRNTILLEVSYLCGNLCGKGYYVLLRKGGGDWHYAMITMAWIS